MSFLFAVGPDLPLGAALGTVASELAMIHEVFMHATETVARKTSPKVWEATYLLNRRLTQDLRRVLDELFPLGGQGRFLDVGCGYMPYRHLFAGRCAEYVGCDAFPSLAEVVQCPADDLHFEDASFDTVAAFQVLEHVPRPWKVVVECARVLKPGGRLLLTTPFLFPYHGSPHDYFRYTHEGLATLCEDAGLSVERTLGQCTSLGTMALLTSYYQAIVWHWFGRRWWGRPVELAGLAFGSVPVNALGRMLDRVPFRHDYTRGTTGFSNFLVVARKPLKA